MATPAWQIAGQCYETCSCDFVCPCILGQMAVRPSKGTCTFAMAMEIREGTYGDVPLDGLGFIVLALTPEEMGKGNWSVGLVIDERASAEQREAITAIGSGAAGGPIAFTGFLGTFLGVELAPIRFEGTGVTWSVDASPLVDMAADHPASAQMAVARARKSHVDAFGITWDDASGMNNGRYAPFAWRSA